MTYAIISVGGKQYRVHEGQRLLVDRLPTAEGETFSPAVLLLGGDGGAQVAPDGVTVTARVVGAERGPKIRIGKYRKRTGYKRHTGFRAALSAIEIESIGAAKKTRAAKPKAEPAASAEAAAEPTVEATAAEAKPARTRAPRPKPAAKAAEPAATGEEEHAAPKPPRRTRKTTAEAEQPSAPEES